MIQGGFDRWLWDLQPAFFCFVKGFWRASVRFPASRPPRRASGAGARRGAKAKLADGRGNVAGTRRHASMRRRDFWWRFRVSVPRGTIFISTPGDRRGRAHEMAASHVARRACGADGTGRLWPPRAVVRSPTRRRVSRAGSLDGVKLNAGARIRCLHGRFELRVPWDGFLICVLGGQADSAQIRPVRW